MNKRNCVRHILHTRFHTKMCNKENMSLLLSKWPLSESQTGSPM